MPISTETHRRAAPAASLLAAFAVTLATTAAPAGAAGPPPTDRQGAVLIESPRATITVADYDAELDKLKPEARASYTANRQRVVQMVNALYLNRATSREARAAGLDRDPVVARQIELLVEKTLAQLWIAKLDRDTAAKFDAEPEKYVARAREVYLTNPDKYRSPERVRASHVLVRIKADGEAAAKARAEELRAKIAAGAPIATVARESSDDPSAKRNGGDLGFLAAKDVDPAFAAAAFALTKRGELSPVVKSRFGYHVIEFVDRQPAKQQTFDEVKRQILAEVRQALIENERSEYQNSLISDPPAKLNDPLITRISNDAAGMGKPGDASSKAPR